jgi:L-asparaginase II
MTELPTTSTMENPVLIDVWRGDGIESVHRGAAVVVNSLGEVVFSVGDIDQFVFPRSAVKMIQALPLLETGAADKFKLTDREIALACASHGGENDHVIAIESWLSRIGLSIESLECGVHEPFDSAAARELAAVKRNPCVLHNNCSGKHAGFLTTAKCSGDGIRGYVHKSHPVQQRVSAALCEMADFDLRRSPSGKDGCGIPAHSLPLRSLAHCMARFAAPAGLGQRRMFAAKRILESMIKHPWFVGGSAAFDTRAMELAKSKLVVKMGAEGVQVAIVPSVGLGIAVKIDDGTKRAAEIATAKILAALGLLGEEFLSRHGTLQNSRGETIGRLSARFEM